MKVTLIYPGIAGQGFNTAGKGMDGGWISHGLASLSAVAKRRGHEVNLIDLRALRSWEHFGAEMRARQPEVVGVTMMSVDYNPTMRSLEIIRDINPQIITAIGGAHPTILPDEVVDDPRTDHVFLGEGETSFPDFLAALARGEKPPHVIPGEHPNLDELPFIDHDLFLNEWRKAGYTLDSPEVPFCVELPPPFVTIIAGRGCIYNCSFCQPAERQIFGKGVRRRRVANVIAELKELQDKYHFNSFMFHDDCLTEDREWVTEFCHAYRAAGFTQPFFCQSRADIIVKHEDMVELMAEVGLRGYFIGFESGSDRVLRFIRKGTTREKNIKAAEICRRYGISIWANYMLGLPTETKEEVMETVSMLKIIDPDYYSPAFYTPHPGSDLYDYCIENDLSLITDHDSYRRNPTEIKIRGQDEEFLKWALAESQRRTWQNQLKRTTRYYWGRYAAPRKWARKTCALAGKIGHGCVGS